MAGEWLTATANTNMFTYEIAPVFILMENVVLSKMRKIIGWDGGDSILAPGGSISNLYAFLAARHKMFPNYKEHGARALPGELVMFTSDQCHYSVKSCAAVCGLGTDNCVMVPSDEHGRLIPAELERLILERKARGQIPFFVNATAGTTVLGAFDPINAVADICEKYNCWFHVDVSVLLCLFNCVFFLFVGTNFAILLSFHTKVPFLYIFFRFHIFNSIFKTLCMNFKAFPSSSTLLSFQAAWGGGLLLSKKYRHPRFTGIERYVAKRLAASGMPLDTHLLYLFQCCGLNKIDCHPKTDQHVKSLQLAKQRTHTHIHKAPTL